MHQIYQFKSFKYNRFDRTQNKIKILKKFGFRDPIINSVRFVLIYGESSRVAL